MEQKFNDYFGNTDKLRNRRSAVSLLIMTVVAFVIIALFQIMYNSTKQNILNVWENNVIQLSRSAEYYLARPADVIEFTAAQVEDMIDRGEPNREINDYLIGEMDHYASLVENNYTGVYGYINGEYLDASGWVPGHGYKPSQRPWYLAAKKNKGKVTLVTPFRNMQTNELMMSISKLLDDGKSVISIDIYMEGLQSMIDNIASEEGIKQVFISDKKGSIIAHSDQAEIGRNYLNDGGYHSAIIETAFKAADSGKYSATGPIQDEVIYADRINDDWCAVIVLDEAQMLHSLGYVNIILVVFLVIAIFTWYLISKSINDKYNEAERLSKEINAVADIYEAMILVDLKTDCMTILRNTDKLQKHIGEDLNGYSRRIIDLCGKIASESSRDMLKQFMDPGTYEERIQNSRSISHDFIDCNGRWTRFQIIVVDRNDDGSLRHIIWAIESVDEEYRQQEHLRKLADTDALSGLNNRRSGETGVREMIEKGTSGLFLLIDIDDFKMFNDTFGHDIGDLVIISVADCIRKAFRESDIVFRLGGDEFAAYAVGVNNTVSENIITSRIRNEVDNLELKELGDTKITISIGTAFNPPASEKAFEDIYQEADQKMYDEKRSKHVGR